MATRIQHRRGTAAEWALANPVLAEGELGFEEDTKVIKLGDGLTAWNDLSLPYLSTGGGTLSGVLDMSSNFITNLPSPTLDVHAISRGWANGTYLALSGGTLAGILEMGSNAIQGLPSPVNANDASRKSYVDSAVSLATRIEGLGQDTTSTAITSDPGGTALVNLASVSVTSGRDYYISGHARLWNSSGAEQIAYLWVEFNGTVLAATNAAISSIHDSSNEALNVQVERLRWTAPSNQTGALKLVCYRKVGGTSLSVQASTANPSEVQIRTIPAPIVS